MHEISTILQDRIAISLNSIRMKMVVSIVVSLFYLQLREMVTWGLQEDRFQTPPTHLAVWRSSSMDTGGQCVMTHLVPMMRM